ncbi:MAG: GtrA family protein [Rhodoferax sp.]|nr:GtrA family protein [Rhodoferax sp.]MDP3651262.1 GtrA family protein [Rhodoferax sp.]
MKPSVLLQFLHYGAVGGLALAVDVGSFHALRAMDMSLVLANVFARLGGAVAAYAGNYFWTFSRSERLGGWLRSAWRYVLLWTSATLFSTLLLAVITAAGAGEIAAKLGVEMFVVVFNFFIARHWVFR